MDYVIKDTDLTAIANAIRSKNGSSDTYTVAEMPNEIKDITGEPNQLDVDFVDYDGSLIYSYAAQQFLLMNSMPENPFHDGLIAQGWNWTLADAKNYVTKYGALVIGQNYITYDGKTRVYVKINDLNSLNFTIRLQASVSGGAVIDWGIILLQLHLEQV